MSTRSLVVAGFFVHAILFISVFDIYFYSPLVDGTLPHASKMPAPAKRLVFIVADGLRADKLLMLQPDGSTPAPFLRSIAEKEGSWGVAIAGIPTATRPGHVAMTAGFYEDPTSVAKDIGGGDIKFDTVFSETKYTWTWDTPQFLGKVAAAHPNKIFSEKFPGDQKYLAGINPEDMDSWVFDEVKKFMQTAKSDDSLKMKLQEDKLLFFLHLGGIDHAGYIVRPQAPEYNQHVQFLDNGVKNVVDQFEDLFQHDGKTAYVFASDHGMTNWGAHGDGTPDEIQTPLLVWGSGIRKAYPENNPMRYKDTLSADWSLTKWKRTDIEQPSMAPLLAAIIGIPFPRNAVYPVPDEYFDLPDEEMQAILYANLEQLLDNFVAIEKHVHKGPLAFSFRLFVALTENNIRSIKTDIESLIFTKNYEQAIKLTKEKIQLVTQGIRHYTTYSRRPLWWASFSSIIGWFSFCLLVIVQQQQNWEDIKVTTPLMTNTKHIIIQCSLAVAIFHLIFLYAQSTPVTHCVHFLMPVPLWTAVIIKWYEIGNVLPIFRRMKELLPMAGFCLFCVVLASMSFHYRFIISLILVGFAVWTSYKKYKHIEKNVLIQWVISLMGMAVLVGRPFGNRDLNYNLVLFSGIVGTVASLYLKFKTNKYIVKGNLFRHFESRFASFQVFMIVLATVVLYYTSYLTDNDIRTPLFIQITSWTILIVSLLETFVICSDIQSRMMAMTFGYLAPYILLSICQESLFFVVFCWNGFLFIEIEKSITKSQPIFLPKTSTNSTINRVPKINSVSNGKSFPDGHTPVKPYHHKHTKSNDILMLTPAVSEWQSLDFATSNESEMKCKRVITTGDLRRTLYMLVSGFCTVYGTGHVASVNSFDVQDVFCFLTVSNPPRMGVLMVLKVIIPGLVFGCFVRAANMVTYTSLRNFSTLLFSMANIVGLVAFLLMTDAGTWTETGQAVSQHVLAQGICMFLCLQFGIVNILTTFKIIK